MKFRLVERLVEENGVDKGSSKVKTNQSEEIRLAAKNGAENNSQYKLDYTETMSGSTWKLYGKPKGPKSERGGAFVEITPTWGDEDGFKVSRWSIGGDQLEKQTFSSIDSALQAAKAYLRQGYKTPPKFITYDNEEYIREEEMTGGAWSYVHWDSNNDAHYITVHANGEIEAD